MSTEPGQDITWGETHVGTRSVFAAAGFDRGRPPDPPAARHADRFPASHRWRFMTWQAHRSSSFRGSGSGRGPGTRSRPPRGRRPRRHGPDAARARVGRRRPVLDHVPGPRRRDHPTPSRRPSGRPSSWSTARPGSPGTRRATRRPGADRGDGLRRHRAREAAARPGFHGCREADDLGFGRRGGEPRRVERASRRPRSASGPCRFRAP